MDASPGVHEAATFDEQAVAVQNNSESVVIVRYAPDEALEWPWSITHEEGRPVLTITDLDDSSLGIVLRAVAQAEGAPTGRRSDPQPNGVRVSA